MRPDGATKQHESGAEPGLEQLVGPSTGQEGAPERGSYGVTSPSHRDGVGFRGCWLWVSGRREVKLVRRDLSDGGILGVVIVVELIEGKLD